MDQRTAVSHAQRHLLIAGLICYGFDALDFMTLTLALPLLIAQWHLTLGEAGLLGTAGMVGVGFSALVLGWYADRYGRRPALIASVVIFALFTAAIALARNRWEVMALRFIAGFGIGGVWGVVTTLIKEVWPPPRFRGAPGSRTRYCGAFNRPRRPLGSTASLWTAWRAARI